MIRPPKDALKRRGRQAERGAERVYRNDNDKATGKHTKRIPLGPLPPRSPETRRALSSVTPAREVRAEELAREHAPEGFEGMIRAEEVEG
jgi:hypothetical protein